MDKVQFEQTDLTGLDLSHSAALSHGWIAMWVYMIGPSTSEGPCIMDYEKQ